jgi:hypothetical protein
MPHLTMLDLASRVKPMAEKKKRWISKAVPESHKGRFRAKAEAAGMSTREFAAKHAGDSGKTGAQARLAKTLMGMGKKRRGSVLYDRKKED